MTSIENKGPERESSRPAFAMLSRTALRTRLRLASRPRQVNGLRCYSRIIQGMFAPAFLVIQRRKGRKKKGKGGRLLTSTITEHDVLLLRQKGARNATKRQVTPPIRSDTTFKAAWGVRVNGSDLIGRTLPCTIQDSKGNNMRLSEVTLAQYVTNIPRMATPVWLPGEFPPLPTGEDIHRPDTGNQDIPA